MPQMYEKCSQISLEALGGFDLNFERSRLKIRAKGLMRDTSKCGFGIIKAATN